MMKKATKVWLIVAGSLVLLGCLLFVTVMSVTRWNFLGLSTQTFETIRQEIAEPFEGISIQVDTTDVLLVLSEDERCTVVCYEQANQRHAVAVKDGCLVIESVDTRKWYEHVGVQIDSPSVTVYLPKKEYGVLSIRSSTGDVEIPQALRLERIDVQTSTGDVSNYASATGKISIMATTGKILLRAVAAESIELKASTGHILGEGISTDTMSLTTTTGKITFTDVTCNGMLTASVSTGDTTLKDVTCGSLTSVGETGDLVLRNVIAAERFSIERDTGDVRFEGADAAELRVKTDTGSVKGNLLTEKIFFVESDTGKREFPKTVTGGRCEITTDTGDVVLTVG